MGADLLSSLTIAGNYQSRAVNAENPTGEKGKGGTAAGPLGRSRKGRPCLTNILPGSETVLADIQGPGEITHIWITVPNKTSEAEPFVLRDLVLAFYWDEETKPSVHVPLGDFFCCGFGRECIIQSLPVAVLPNRGFNSYFRMPFRRRARIMPESGHPNPIPAFFYQIDYRLSESLPEDTVYFHAQWRRESLTRKGEDYVVLDGVRGRGHYVGTYLGIAALERYWWGEGEFKFYIDGDREYPTICGTGTEDYFGGSWSFARQENGRTVEQNYCSPFLGYPYYSRHDTLVHNDYHNDDIIPSRGFYRWHLPDSVYFQEDLKVTVQQIGVGHGGLFERQDDVCSVAYWYQAEPHAAFAPLPEAALRRPR